MKRRHRFLAAGAALTAIAGRATAQSCANYATALSNGTCACPPGLTGSDCSHAACDNPLLPPSQRTPFSAVLSSNASEGCTRQCSDGFGGPTCNTCQTNEGCRTALGTGSTSSVASGLGQPVCNGGAWTWTEGFGTCDVVNPTLQSTFSGSTTLTFQKTVSPTDSLSPSYSGQQPSSVLAQLWYAPLAGSNTNTTVTEQFYCSADSCVQSNRTSAGTVFVDYTCQNLHCTCIPGTTFCGAAGSPIDLTDTINGLSNQLQITCDAGLGSTCSFKQDVLKTLFGSGGLALSGCKWGECVLPSTIDTLAAQLDPSSSSSGGGGDELSGGVIAGLAVLGAVLLVLLGLLAAGYASQQRARKRAVKATKGGGLSADGAGLISGSSDSSALAVTDKDKDFEARDRPGAVGIRMRNLSYSLPPTSRLSSLKPSSWFPSLSSSSVSSSTDLDSIAINPRAHDEDTGRLVLRSIDAEIQGGSFCSILGPSGAGKSTLVDLLAGVRKNGFRGGGVELMLPSSSSASSGLGEGELEKESGRVRIGYVDQQDVLPETATVREAVEFAAELKLGEVPKEVKRDRTFLVLSQLGLLDVADSPIGSSEGSEKRGISGGERRRVSIARELVAQPAMLILDEPTSGLDSSSALRILLALKALTQPDPSNPLRQATTVILTIHQPSSQLFHMFDDVLLLAKGGEQMYFGPKESVARWFEEKGTRCPEGWNPADRMFTASSALLPPVSRPNRSLRPADMLDLASTPSPPSRKTSLAPPSPAIGMSRRRSSALPTILLKNENAHAEAESRTSTTTLTQVQVLVKRGMRELVRDRSLLVMHTVVPLVTGLIVGGMFYQVDLTIGGFQSRIGSLFFLGSLLSFASLSALTHFSHAKALFVRERARGYFHSMAWLSSTVVLDVLPLRLLPTILLGVIVYFMVGLAATAAHFFKFLLILLLFTIATTLWNFFLAAAITDVGVAILISSIINLGQLAYAGFFLNLSRIPPVLRWLQWLCPLKYVLEALSVNEVGAGLMIDDQLEGARVQVSAEVIMKTLFGFEGDAYHRDVLVLFGFICGFALLLIGTVLLKLRELR
ncbi:hypothetical protein JCM11251_002890 [Rhodosporidiobolus azoricus]